MIRSKLKLRIPKTCKLSKPYYFVLVTLLPILSFHALCTVFLLHTKHTVSTHSSIKAIPTVIMPATLITFLLLSEPVSDPLLHGSSKMNTQMVINDIAKTDMASARRLGFIWLQNWEMLRKTTNFYEKLEK